MKQRNAILIAAVVTAFLLVTAGGVLARVTQASTDVTTSASADAATSVVAEATATLDPQVEALVLAREAQYREQLQAANARLQAAYAQQQALADQLAQSQAQAQPAAQPEAQAAVQSAGYAVTPEQALLVALGAAPGNAPVSNPELVSFQGIAAYEVGLSGGLIYVDASTGAVLYNGVAAAVVSAPQTGGYSDDDHESGEEHEGHGDDHDD